MPVRRSTTLRVLIVREEVIERFEDERDSITLYGPSVSNNRQLGCLAELYRRLMKIRFSLRMVSKRSIVV